MADRPLHPLHPVRREHLVAMTGPLGMWQHATGPVANRAFGYCTDDMARALVVDLEHARQIGWDAVAESAWRALRFLGDAFDPAEQHLRNFRGADGGWAKADPSQDSQGRALLALGVALGERRDPHFGLQAKGQFAAVLPGAARLTSPRAVASALLGCDAALEGIAHDDVLRSRTEAAFAALAAVLRTAFDGIDTHRSGWPWPEPILAYENALLPHALIVAGRRLRDAELAHAGLGALAWLIEVQAAGDGGFSPVGSDGWWPRGGTRSRFDQQPIEATSMILACEAASSVSSDPRYLAAAERAYAWFLGDNDVGVPVALPDSGGCQDGLEPQGVNANQGAESTLMWLLALERMRAVRPDETGSSGISPAGRHTPAVSAVSAASAASAASAVSAGPR